MINEQEAYSMTQINPAKSAIFFQPWVGNQYFKQDGSHPRILLLGESHYYRNDRDDPCQLTIEVVKSYVYDCEKYRFFTIASKICSGEHLEDKKKQELWERISYYNYIQEPVGENPRDRPSAAMWGNSLPAFKEVLNLLKPNIVLMLGKALWNNFPEGYGSALGEICINGSTRLIWQLPYEGGNALSTWVYHPSSWRGGNSAQGHQIFNALKERLTTDKP
jgi:hypothetical protein